MGGDKDIIGADRRSCTLNIRANIAGLLGVIRFERPRGRVQRQEGTQYGGIFLRPVALGRTRTSFPGRRNSLGKRTAWLPPCLNSFAVSMSLTTPLLIQKYSDRCGRQDPAADRLDQSKRLANVCATPEMAVRLEKALGSTADTWLRMQMNFDLARVRKQTLNVKRLAPA